MLHNTSRIVRVGCAAAASLLLACSGFAPGPVDPPMPTTSPNPTPEQLRARVSARGGDIIALIGQVVASPTADPVTNSNTCTAPGNVTADGWPGPGYDVRGRWVIPMAPAEQPERIKTVYEQWKRLYDLSTALPDLLAAHDQAKNLHMEVDGTRPEIGLVVIVVTTRCYPLPVGLKGFGEGVKPGCTAAVTAQPDCTQPPAVTPSPTRATRAHNPHQQRPSNLDRAVTGSGTTGNLLPPQEGPK